MANAGEIANLPERRSDRPANPLPDAVSRISNPQDLAMQEFVAEWISADVSPRNRFPGRSKISESAKWITYRRWPMRARLQICPNVNGVNTCYT